MLHASDAWRARTGGAFDPAAQAIIALLRDGGAGARPTTRCASCSRRCADRAGSSIGARGIARRLTTHAISVDAIAKGYIVTRAAALARAVDGVSDVLLNVGGDVQHFGEHAVAVGIADPFAPAENAPPIAVVRLQNAAIATSGGYRRGFIAQRPPRLAHRRSAHRPAGGAHRERVRHSPPTAPPPTHCPPRSACWRRTRASRSPTRSANVGCLLVERDGTITTNATWNARAVAPRHVSSEESIDARHA